MTTKTSKTTPVAPRAREDQVRMAAGAVIAYLRRQAGLGEPSQLDFSDLARKVPPSWRGRLAVLRALSESGESPTEQVLRGRLFTQTGELLRAHQEAAGLGDQAPAMLDAIRDLPDLDQKPGVRVRLTHTNQVGKGWNPPKPRPVTRRGVTVAPHTEVETVLTTRQEWVQWSSCRWVEVEVLEGDPQAAGLVPATL